jgi:hypothetical protein
MFETYNFRLTQFRAVKAVMDDFASFTPDDKTPAQVATMVTSAEAALEAAEEAWTDLNLARGERDEKASAGHDAVVDVYAVMKRRYRKDPGSYDSISKLPVDDGSPAETLRRMKLTSKLWGRLPNPPGSATAFKAWDTMGQTEFDVLVTALKDAIETEEESQEEWDKVNGEMKELQEEMEDFVTTALNQGRAQYPEGTAERAAIDGIPTDGGSTPLPLPGPAQVTLTGTDPGTYSLELAAENDDPSVTGYDVWERLVGAPDFAKVGDNVPGGQFVRMGLAAGEYDVKAQARNATGLGPDSDVVTLTIP